jgi:D-3-phosphoglycerate dehydrogenase / 2-oxoglutarate reductase
VGSENLARTASKTEEKIVVKPAFQMFMDTQDWDSIEIEKTILAEVGCEVIPLNFTSDAELLDAIRDADALLPRYVNISRRHIEAMSRCKVIARSGIGVDIVDVDAATEHGIWVTNVPDYCVEEVAEHAVALILACTRKLIPYFEDVRGGTWKWQSGKKIFRISGSTFGLIGFGKIGRLIWQRMKGFGCKGLIVDPFVNPEIILSEGAHPSTLYEVLDAADMVHIQAPLTSQTHHLIGEDELRRMKPTAVLTNTARGPIIDEHALYRALSEKWIAAAGLDDLEEEPAKSKNWIPSNPILQLPNVIVTPHTAWYSEHSVEEVKRVSASEVARVLSGLQPLYPVNKPKARSEKYD